MIPLWLSLACSGSVEPADSGWEPGTWDAATAVEDAQVLAAGLDGPWGLAAMESNLLVVERGLGRLLQVADDGTVETLAENLEGARWVAAGSGGVVVVGDTAAWWIDLEDGAVSLLTDALTAGGPAALNGEAIALVDPTGLWLGDPDGLSPISLSLEDPTDLAWSGETLWIAEAQGLVQVDATGGWLAETEVEDTPTALVAAEDTLYLTATSSRWPYPGWVLGGQPGDLDTLSITPPEPGRIALTPEAVIWASKQSVTSVPREGGAYTVVGARTAVEDLVVLSGSAVWTDAQRGLVLKAAVDPE